jgi:hypothetical protein
VNQFIVPYAGVMADLSHQHYLAPLIFLYFWAATMWKSGGIEPHLPLSYRIQNVCLSFYFVLIASMSVDLGLWCVFHPGSVPKYFYVQSGIIPPAASLLILILMFVGVVLEIKLGFLMAQQRRRARTLGLRLLPYLLAINLLDAMRIISKHAATDPQDFMVVAPLAILFGMIPYVWLYLFLRSKQTEMAMVKVP